MISIPRLHTLLTYDPDSGNMTWAQDRGRKAKSGQIAGASHGAYWRIKLDGRMYYRHILAWAYVHGVWPEHEVDHRDRDSRNDRIANLRPATPQQNSSNKRTYRTNRLGLKGVHQTRTGRFHAQIQRGGKKIGLGTYATPEEARAAYVAACEKFHGDFASPN